MRGFARTVCFVLLLVVVAVGSLLVLQRREGVLPVRPVGRPAIRGSATPSVPASRLPAIHPVPLPAARVPPELVVLRKGWLWTGHITNAGLPSGRLTRIGRVRAERGVQSLEVSPDRRWAAVEVAGPEVRQGMVLLVALGSGGPEIHLSGSFEPTFSPDSRTLAFSRACPSLSGGWDVCLLDLRTLRQRVLRAAADGAYWLADGHSIALADEGTLPNYNSGYLILDVSSDRVMDQFYPGVSPLRPIVSPDGRFVGVCHKISRPQVGTAIFDRRTRQFLDADCVVEGYNPALLTAWSPDGTRLLWNLTVPDPDNDGSNLGDTVACSSLRGRQQRFFGRGGQAHFSPDSRHVLWIDRWSETDPRAGRLLWCSLGGRPHTLLTDVTAFDVIGSSALPGQTLPERKKGIARRPGMAG